MFQRLANRINKAASHASSSTFKSSSTTTSSSSSSNSTFRSSFYTSSNKSSSSSSSSSGSSSYSRFRFRSSSSSARDNFHRFYTTFRDNARSQAASIRRNFSTMMGNFGSKYSEYLESHPFTTQMVTSGILGGAADVTTQYLEHGWAEEDGKKPKPWDWRRLAAVTAFGVIGMGPMGHVWYIYLDRFTRAYCRTNRSMVLTKVAGDTFVFGPVCLWLFFASVSVMEGTEWETIRRKLWRDFVPTYLIDYSFWPIVQGTNFHFIPVRHQLLVVNTCCFFDDIFLTYVQHNELPGIFLKVEQWWERFYEKYLLGPGEKMEDIFFEDEDD